MEKPGITILQALENEEIFVSVRKNRLYNAGNPTKSSHKLVLAITAESKEGRHIIQKIKKSVQPSEVFVEAHEDSSIVHLLIYCKNAQIVAQVMELSVNGNVLRSNTRYEKIDKKELQLKAELFEAELVG